MPEQLESAGKDQGEDKEAKQASDEKEGESKAAIPAGIIPLFFSGASQQIFECVTDSDLTVEIPHKLIPKEKIVEDFKNRAAVSDFHPVKKTLLAYPGEEILLVYDYDFKYGENFYVCVTEEAKERVLNPPEEEGGEGKGGEDEEEEEEEPIPRTPEPKEWVCQGSDLEILEGFVHLSRPLLKFTVSRKRIHFGAPVTFSDRNAGDTPEGYHEIASQEDPNFELQRTEVDTAVQAVTDKIDAASQTVRCQPCNAMVQYTPRTMSEGEAQAALEGPELSEFLSNVFPRLEVSLQQNEIMDLFVDDYKTLSDRDWITGNQSDATLKEYQSFTDLKFSKDKKITWIDLHPTIKGIVAVSCGENYAFEERIELFSRLLHSSSLILIWSFTDPIHPQLFLEAPDDILCFKFNPANPNIIAGGCINGQIVLWDIEAYQDRLQINKASDPTEARGIAANMAIFDTDPKLDHAPMVRHCALSSIEHGHGRAVCDIHWVPDHIEVCTKTAQVLENTSHDCSQLVSCSIDGTVMFWDTRQPPQKVSGKPINQSKLDTDLPFHYLDLTWKPFIKVPLPRSDYPGNFAATRVSIREKQREIPKCLSDVHAVESEEVSAGRGPSEGKDPPPSEGTPIEGASTMFFVGSEDGELVCCDWVPTRDQESGRMIASHPEYHFNAHCGPVYCVERSPFFRDIVLSVGGWTFAIWKEGNKNDALLKSCSSTVPLTGGTWSPTRPGVFFITKLNGNIDVWDLMDRSHEPALAQNISSFSITAINSLPFKSKQSMLALGDSGGTLHILEVPWGLGHPSSNEVSIMAAFFDREVKRVEFAAERAVVRANEKRAHDVANMEREKEEREPKQGESWEDRAKKDYEEYLAMENALLIELGVIEVPNEED